MSNDDLRSALTLHATCSFADTRTLAEYRVDCCEFHSIPTKFDLPIDATEIFNVSTWREPSQIARPVDATELRMINELFSSGLWAVAIAPCKSDAADTEFAFTSTRNLAQRLVDNAYGVAFNRSTDCDCDARINPSANDCDGAFGWTIPILEPSPCAPKVCKILRQRFATDINQF